MLGHHAVITVFLGIICVSVNGQTNPPYFTCPISQDSSKPVVRSSWGKTSRGNKYIGGKVTSVGAMSAVTCQLQCQAKCLCAFANYKETSLLEDAACELVEFGSCDRADVIKLQTAKGWTATKFSRIEEKIETEGCCKTTSLQNKLASWCQGIYSGSWPAFGASQTSTNYEWRCYQGFNKDRYYYVSGSSYYSRQKEIAKIIENAREFKSAKYVIGGLGRDCRAVCSEMGRECSPVYTTLNAVYIFHRLGVKCQVNKSESDCFSKTNPPVYYPGTNRCAGFVHVDPKADCDSYSHPSARRLCHCVLLID